MPATGLRIELKWGLFMADIDRVVVQVVMKDELGGSILTQQTPRAGAGDVSPERAATIRRKLEILGFEVLEGNLNTLSVAGPPGLLAETLGITADAASAGVAAHATRIIPELEPFVADAFIPPAPEFFP